MKFYYPAVYHKEEGSIWVSFPDFETCFTYGENFEDSEKNASEALSSHVFALLEKGERLPKATDIFTIKATDDSFASLVCGDVKSKSKSVKKTLTIPQWLNDMAEREHINFSSILQNALRQELHLE